MTPNEEAIIRLYRVYKDYERKSTALIDINLEINKGDFVFLTGPSGAGKTTLLKLLFRSEKPTRGTVIVNGRNVPTIPTSKIAELRREMGIIFQDFKLLKNRSVFDNITFVQKILGVSLKERNKKSYNILKRVGIEHKRQELPPQLSGGEQQRVAIARALINDPGIILADEPTGNLDPDMSYEIMKILLDYSKEKEATVLVATHDRELMQKMGQPVITLDNGRITGFK